MRVEFHKSVDKALKDFCYRHGIDFKEVFSSFSNLPIIAMSMSIRQTASGVNDINPAAPHFCAKFVEHDLNITLTDKLMKMGVTVPSDIRILSIVHQDPDVLKYFFFLYRQHTKEKNLEALYGFSKSNMPFVAVKPFVTYH